MNTIKAGIQGATPTLAVQPVDPKLPRCEKLVDGERCTRKQGHYGPCGVAT